jgi:hypothetical protein
VELHSDMYKRLKKKNFSRFPAYTTNEDGTGCFETSALKIQTQQNHPKEIMQQDEFSSDFLFLCPVEQMKQKEQRHSESRDATVHITINIGLLIKIINYVGRNFQVTHPRCVEYKLKCNIKIYKIVIHNFLFH